MIEENKSNGKGILSLVFGLGSILSAFPFLIVGSAIFGEASLIIIPYLCAGMGIVGICLAVSQRKTYPNGYDKRISI